MNIHATSSPQPILGQASASRQENLITVILGLWLIFGFFIDGYAHGNLRSIESIFTPWHAILYSGFFATSGWMLSMITRRLNHWQGLKAIPIGYELGLLGVFIFGFGGIADLSWHTVFGIEVGLDALRSPSHIMLFIGALLLMTAPLRASWLDPNAKPNPSLLEFLPVLFVVFATFAFASLMNLHVWGLVSTPDSIPELQKLNTDNPALRYALYGFVDSSILLTNAAMMLTMLLLLQRWQTPFGTFGLIFGLSTLVLVVIVDTNLMLRVWMAALAGTMIDALIHLLKPHPTRVLELRIFAALAPLLIWGTHFLAVQVTGGLGISPELWTGILSMGVLSGLALSLLVAPTARPSAF